VRYVLHQVEHFYAAITIWRLMREKYARVAYDGGGGLVSSGRWHHAGHRVAYASEHAALAVLEN
jgi:RES domain-containing protein